MFCRGLSTCHPISCVCEIGSCGVALLRTWTCVWYMPQTWLCLIVRSLQGKTLWTYVNEIVTLFKNKKNKKTGELALLLMIFRLVWLFQKAIKHRSGVRCTDDTVIQNVPLTWKSVSGTSCVIVPHALEKTLPNWAENEVESVEIKNSFFIKEYIYPSYHFCSTTFKFNLIRYHYYTLLISAAVFKNSLFS